MSAGAPLGDEPRRDWDILPLEQCAPRRTHKEGHEGGGQFVILLSHFGRVGYLLRPSGSAHARIASTPATFFGIQ
jgi:hypothetical protein